MTKTYHFMQGQKKHDGWHPEVKLIREPVIIGRKNIFGTLHYIGEDGKKYVAADFDKFWKRVKTEIKDIRFKGELIGDNWI